MSDTPRQLQTERLVLRRWQPADREPFAAVNADPAVMEHYPAPLTRRQSDGFVDRIEAHFERHGWGPWALSLGEDQPFIGYTGLWPAIFEASFTPAVEVGWRLARPYWGRGLATEAATAAAADGFERLGLDEIVSFTSKLNARSQRVMQKLGMRRDPDEEFDHPNVAPGHRLRRHVLYRLPRSAWFSSS